MTRFSFWLGTAGLILGAVFGAIDLNWVGGVVGATVGSLVGSLVGEIMDLLIAPFFATPSDHRISRWFFRLLVVGLLIVFAHEFYWACNFASLAATHNIGARLTHLVARNESPEAVKETLNAKRWQADIFVIRPVRWLLRDDVYASAHSTQEFIDAETRSRTASNPALAVRGREIAARSEKLIDKYIPWTWLLRFLPRDVFLPKE